jgi:IPT/TIG domain
MAIAIAPVAAPKQSFNLVVVLRLLLFPIFGALSIYAGMQWNLSSPLYGLLALVLLALASAAITGTWNPARLVLGQDGRVSTSKFQHWLWTIVVVFTYVLLTAERLRNGKSLVVNTIPVNVLLAMGFVITTTTAAKAITVSYVRHGDVTKTAKADGESAVAGLVASDDAEIPDLAKIQMLVFTVIAATIYLVLVFHRYVAFGACDPSATVACQYPDIDDALMVLMGLAQGAYLGNKLTTKDTPRLGRLEPPTGARGATVTLRGAAFGGGDGSWVLLNGTPIPTTSWADDSIAFAVPRRRPSDGTPWRFGDIVQLELVSNGRRSANTVPFQIAPPVIRSMTSTAKPGGLVVLTGACFGVVQDDSEILFDGRPIPVRATSWTDTEIKFVVPIEHPDKTQWPKAPATRNVLVQLRIDGQDAPSTQTLTV